MAFFKITPYVCGNCNLLLWKKTILNLADTNVKLQPFQYGNQNLHRMDEFRGPSFIWYQSFLMLVFFHY